MRMSFLALLFGNLLEIDGCPEYHSRISFLPQMEFRDGNNGDLRAMQICLGSMSLDMRVRLVTLDVDLYCRRAQFR